jgi:glycosyltransferase involved in cell wall biosynthesis
MDNKFIIIVPVYNAERYIDKCLDSILSQDYYNYELVVIDDCSSDNTPNIVNAKNCGFIVYRNEIRLGSASGNIANAIKLFSKDGEDIIVTVDGDDFLANDKVLSYLNGVYQDKDVYMTYGQYIPLSNSYGKFCKPIPDTRTYRRSGEWFASHLRTFKSKLWFLINDSDLRDEQGNYYKVAGDASWLYPMIEMCGKKHCKFIDEILYIYNDLNPANDMKKNVREQVRVAKLIRSKKEYKEII